MGIQVRIHLKPGHLNHLHGKLLSLAIFCITIQISIGQTTTSGPIPTLDDQLERTTTESPKERSKIGYKPNQRLEKHHKNLQSNILSGVIETMNHISIQTHSNHNRTVQINQNKNTNEKNEDHYYIYLNLPVRQPHLHWNLRSSDILRSNITLTIQTKEHQDDTTIKIIDKGKVKTGWKFKLRHQNDTYYNLLVSTHQYSISSDQLFIISLKSDIPIHGKWQSTEAILPIGEYTSIGSPILFKLQEIGTSNRKQVAFIPTPNWDYLWIMDPITRKSGSGGTPQGIY